MGQNREGTGMSMLESVPTPNRRLRRGRRNATLRRMVRETQLTVDNLIAPLFIVEGQNIRKPISSMPGQFHSGAPVPRS